MFKFSNRSLKNLEDVNSDLELIATYSLKNSLVDFGISEGLRTAERQKELFETGQSKVKVSKHQSGEAIDVFVAGSKDITFDFNHLSYLAGVFQATARMLYDHGLVQYLIRWGGNWNNNGIIIKDQKFQDLVHFEIYKPSK